jgi:hypothetical protein
MQKLIVLITACAALCIFVSQASAMTAGQVKNTCGKSLQSSVLSNGTSAFGCNKQCGKQICTYNCCTGKSCGEQGCHGYVVGRTIFGHKVKIPMPAYLRLYASSRAHGR